MGSADKSNIHTSTMEGMSLRIPLPPWIFHFYWSTRGCDILRPPTPLEKCIFMKSDYQSKEQSHLVLCNSFHLLSDLAAFIIGLILLLCWNLLQQELT